MGSAAIFSGRRTKLLTGDGLLNSDGSIIDNNGVKNYISNGHAEVNALGWTLYSDAAAARPVDGSGGAPTVTFTRSTTAALSGQGSFLFTSPGAVQGHGAAYDFAIAPLDKAKVLQISFDYMVNSGTFVAGSSTADSDLIVYLYDVANSRLIEPSSIKLLSNSTTLTDRFSATFQTASDSVGYRLILHSATASAAYSLKLDNISVSPSVYVYGTPVTDWQTYNLNITSSGTSPTKGSTITDVARWRRVGDSMEIAFNYYQNTAGTAGTGTYRFSLPSGYSIDTSKINAGGFTDYNRGSFGTASGYNGVAHQGIIYVETSTAFGIALGNDVTTITGVGATFYSLATTTITLNFAAQVPILGWSSSVQMSQPGSERAFSLVVEANANQSIANQAAEGSEVKFTAYAAPRIDTHGSWDATNSQVLIPFSGRYRINLAVSKAVATSNQFAIILKSYKNNVTLESISRQDFVASTIGVVTVDGPGKYDLVAGDRIDLRIFQNSGAALSFSTAKIIVEYEGPGQTIAASETITFRAKSGQPRTYNTSSPTIIYELVDYDSSGSYNSTTGEFTCRTAGKYQVSVSTLSLSTVFAVSGTALNSVKKNGSIVGTAGLYSAETTASTRKSFNGAVDVDALAGDKITIAGYSDTTFNLNSDSSVNFLQIKKVGN